LYEKDSYEVVGKPRPRTDARKQVTGKVEFVGDMYLNGMLYAKGVFSTEHHANILSIDTSEAKKVPGVHAVITHKDIPFNRFGVTIMDQPVLSEKKVRYKGEMVAAIAAETYEIACQAAKLVKVEYERLPAVFDPREAMKEDAPIIPDLEEFPGEFSGNFHMLGGGHMVEGEKNKFLKLRKGDIEKGFAESDVILERKFATSVQKASSIEPLCTLADWKDDGVTIWSTQQCPHGNAAVIADAIGLPLSKTRIVAQAVGGGFGEKNSVGLEPVTAVLSKKAGRPVKFQFTTEEHLMWSGTRHPVYMDLKLGATKDGKLKALKRTCVTGAGGYRGVSTLITLKVTYWGSGPYDVPNQYADCYVVSTNKQTGSALRGFGMTQPTFAIEVMMDMLAEELGMDPLELRLKNIYRDGDYTSTGQCVRAAGIELALNKVADLYGWQITK
jgi:CO/xanthine dehydrogenase Mo-binding subunit